MSKKSNTNTRKPYFFLDGHLRILKGRKEIKIRGWDNPIALQRTPSLSPIWEPFVPDFQLIKPIKKSKNATDGLSAEEQTGGQQTFDFFHYAIHHSPPVKLATTAELRSQALDQFRGSLPSEIARQLENFRVRQWPMLMMFFHDPASIDLAKVNPALAFYLAQHLNADAELIAEKKYSQLRQKELVGLLDLPKTNTTVRTLGKIRPGSITTDNWESLLVMLRGELKKPKTPLAHLAVINGGVLEIVADPVASAAVGNKLLEEVSNDHREKYRGRVIHMIRSALEMQEELQVDKKVTYFRNIKRLYDVHESVTTRYRTRMQQLSDAESFKGDFSNPPIPGIPGEIEPITSPRELVDEGEIQNNCVASYAKKVAKGELYIYRVIGPDERATLSVVNKNKKWEIGELEGKRNSAASKDTEKRVQHWLKNFQ